MLSLVDGGNVWTGLGMWQTMCLLLRASLYATIKETHYRLDTWSSPYISSMDQLLTHCIYVIGLDTLGHCYILQACILINYSVAIGFVVCHHNKNTSRHINIVSCDTLLLHIRSPVHTFPSSTNDNTQDDVSADILGHNYIFWHTLLIL